MTTFCIFHKWHGCICAKCGKDRHIIANWTCKRCGKEMHSWKGCKCDACGRGRTDSDIDTDLLMQVYQLMVASNGERIQTTLKEDALRFMFHDYRYSCVCKKCGAEWHSWDGCKCTKCKATRDEQHAWRGCMCTKCYKSSEAHDWDGCKCRICERKRDEGHLWNACECTRCHASKHSFVDCRCTRCGFVRDSNHKLSGCLCTVCKRQVHDMKLDKDYYSPGMTEWSEVYKCRRCNQVTHIDRTSR